MAGGDTKVKLKMSSSNIEGGTTFDFKTYFFSFHISQSMAVLSLSNTQNNDIFYNRWHLRFKRTLSGQLLVHMKLLDDLWFGEKIQCCHFLILTITCGNWDYPQCLWCNENSEDYTFFDLLLWPTSHLVFGKNRGLKASITANTFYSSRETDWFGGRDFGQRWSY